MTRIIVLCICCLCLNIVPSKAEIITFERGGASDSTGIVDQGALHLETGLMTYGRELGKRQDFRYNLGSALFRYGLIDEKLEARILSNGLILEDRNTGFDNLTLGGKYAFTKQGDLLPAINLISHFDIPLGDSDLENPGFNHSYKFLVEKSLSKKISTLINLGPSFVSRQNSNGNFISTELPYVFNLSYYLSSKLVVFGEVFGSWILTSDLGNPVGLSSGFTYAIRDDLVFDITTFYGLNSEAQDFGLSFGLSYKFF